MLTLNTSIIIAATPEQVRDVLVDFPRHAEWNPFLHFVSGTSTAGEKLMIRISPPGTKAMTIHPKLLVVESPRELRWIGRLPIPGLFSGEHYFIIEPNDGGGVRLIHGEMFRGLLVPLFSRMLNDNTRRGFILMNEALKGGLEG